jgi:hypothetical protein
VQLARSLLLALAALTFAAAHAQLRSVPADAKAGTMRHLQDMIVELDGKAVRLSPGAQIRDAANRLVLPTAVASKTQVAYLVDATGMVHRVWILSKEEALQKHRTLPAAK